MVSHDLLQLSLFLAGLIPVGLVGASLFVTQRAPFKAASVISLVTAGLSVVSVLLHAVCSHWVHDSEVQLGSMFNLDLVASSMLILVCALSIVVVRYSQTYLAGEGGLIRYVRSLLLTLSTVTILVISNNLGVMIGGWIGAGIGLHQLLTFYRNRRQAIIVAHKKFLLTRLADLCFFGFLWLVEHETGSLHLNVVNAFAEARGGLPPSLHLATVLLVIGVLLKTAQVPFHGWMLQVMEAPTPVSALLHAGIVNIGGYVMIRLAPLMAHADLAQDILIGVGLVTAIIGSLVMTTRVSIKIVLAWSTIAQMGFMLVQCGIGVWHLALLHLLAHSLYKAHAFLSSGSAVETWRGSSLVKGRRPSLVFIAAAITVLTLGAAPFFAAFRASPLHAAPSLGPLVIALILSFVPMIARALAAGRRTFGIAMISLFGATVSYFAWHILFEHAASSIDAGTTSPAKWQVVLIGLVVLFLAQTILQANPNGRLARFFQPHLHSGFYIDEWFTRLSFRLWPPRLERPTTVSRRSIVSSPEAR